MTLTHEKAILEFIAEELPCYEPETIETILPPSIKLEFSTD